MIGLVKKKKEKIKPGYKKKIKWAVDEKRRKAKRAENRARGRAEQKGQTSNFLTPSFTCSEENIDFLYELHKENLLGTCLKL